MANIRKIKNKSIGVIKKILCKLDSLNLRKYFYECSLLFINTMLRGSILYSCEMYYNLKEAEIRQLERIEENYLRRIFNTSKGCPISQLYLEIGQYPARFEIVKMRLLYLKYILEQPEESLLKKLYNLQRSNPTRGDWASTCQEDKKRLELTLPQQEIKEMTKSKFSNIIKENIRKHALNYLIEKQSKKGGQITYKKLEIIEYLQPTCEISIKEKQKIFEIRNDMTNIPDNYGNKSVCLCGIKENTKHIYDL